MVAWVGATLWAVGVMFQYFPVPSLIAILLTGYYIKNLSTKIWHIRININSVLGKRFRRTYAHETASYKLVH